MKYRTEIIGYETTPYCTRQIGDGWVVYQSWWAKAVSPVFASLEQAESELETIARANGAYKAIRRKIPVKES